jgi:hypothetical protein
MEKKKKKTTPQGLMADMMRLMSRAMAIGLVLQCKSACGWSGIETVEVLCAGGGRISKTDGLLQRCRVRKFLIHIHLNVGCGGGRLALLHGVRNHDSK